MNLASLNFCLVAVKPTDAPMEGDSVAEDSQEIIFSLHLTQSQIDMESQMPPETSLQMEEIREVITAPFTNMQTLEVKDSTNCCCNNYYDMQQ